jgi:hypothetical protein
VKVIGLGNVPTSGYQRSGTECWKWKQRDSKHRELTQGSALASSPPPSPRSPFYSTLPSSPSPPSPAPGLSESTSTKHWGGGHNQRKHTWLGSTKSKVQMNRFLQAQISQSFHRSSSTLQAGKLICLHCVPNCVHIIGQKCTHLKTFTPKFPTKENDIYCGYCIRVYLEKSFLKPWVYMALSFVFYSLLFNKTLDVLFVSVG